MARTLAELFSLNNTFNFLSFFYSKIPPKKTNKKYKTIVYKHRKIHRFKQSLKLVNHFANTPLKTITTIEATQQPTLIIQ